VAALLKLTMVRLQRRFLRLLLCCWVAGASALSLGGGRALVRTVAESAAALSITLSSGVPAAQATQPLFEANCAACHAGGGNIVARDKTLSKQSLAAHGYASVEAMAPLLARGKGAMPGYGVDCEPKFACTFGPRLSDDDIREVARFVLDQADKGWK